MKKILFTLLAACALAACNDDNDGPEITTDPAESVSFTCAMSVTSDSTALIGITNNETVCDLIPQEDGTYTLRMNEIMFDPGMPFAMTIDAPGLTKSTEGDVTCYTGSTDPIIPEIGSTPYPQFPLSDFSCSVSGDLLTVRFVCTNSDIPINSTAVITNAPVVAADAVGSYSCALTVTDQTTGEVGWTSEDQICDLTQAGDGTYTLTMNDIKFAEQMPFTLDMELPGLAGETQGASAVFTAATDPIIVSGMPIQNFKCSVSGQKLFITLEAQGATAVLVGKLVE